MDNPWKIIAIVFIVLFVSSVGLSFLGVSYNQATGSPLFSRSAPDATGRADAAVQFIRTNLIGPDESVRLLNVTEESGVYRISTEYSSKGSQQRVDVFMTSDGKYVFPSGYRLDSGSQNIPATVAASAGPAAAKKTCTGTSQQETPVMEAFVVSYCPYGTQMQAVIANITANLPTLAAHIKVRYIGEISNGTVQSMHGPAEASENLKQICIREEQPGAYWKYVSCFISSQSGATCDKYASIDTAKLSVCTSDTNRGIRYAQEDFTRASSYGATASPTLVLNGVTVSEFGFGGRNPEAVKSLLCCGFTTQPESCAVSLGTTQAGTGTQATC